MAVLVKFVFLALILIAVSEASPIHQPNAEYKPLTPGRLWRLLLGAHPDGSENGGLCAGCTFVVGIIEQLAQVHNESVDAAIERLCNYLPPAFGPTCDRLIAQYGATVIKMLENEETADRVCQEIEFCANSTCHLFPLPPEDKVYKHPRVYPPPKPVPPGKAGPQFDPLQWIIQKVEETFNSHIPLVDIDDDFYSTEQTFRGWNWRGYDCDDIESNVYPGRIDNGNPLVDSNCNGIYGVDENGRSYEEVLCSGTPQYGIGLIGDSAGAHFHIPPQYLMAQEINEQTYLNLIDILTNEFDWPQQSAATGFMNTSWYGAPTGPLMSSYLVNRARNLCSHRDYQNMGVNGARVGAVASDIMFSLARNSTADHPMLLTYALVGNDVCDWRHSTDAFTTPSQFYDAVVTAMEYLDTRLPPNSHVIFYGLVDGRVLYNTMHDRIHPIGALNNDVTYEQFYDWFNCLEISPCWGWMNSNSTIRNETSAWAAQLSAIYPLVIENNKYRNFDMTYFDLAVQMAEVEQQWVARGGEMWQLIEPVDGFHPSQTSNALIAEHMWTVLETNYTYLLPPVNPNNALIAELFGDQGGYSGS